jgi:PAS domain S-box-containing protein
MKKRTRNPRLVRHDRSLGAFAAVAKAVSQTLDLEQLLDIALAKVFEVMDLGRGVIYLLDTGARELVLKAHRGVPEQLVGALGRIEVTEADIQLWLEHREQAFKLESVFDQATLTRVRSAVGKQREQSYVVTPLWSKEMLRGAMILESRSKCWFGPEELELLQAIGNQIAVAIENAELFEQTRASAEELKVSEAKYRRLVEDMNDGYMVVNWRGKIAFANGKLAEISGYKLKELIGEDAAKLAPPESIPYSLKLARRLEQRRRVRGHLGGALLKKDGERVPVELSLKAIEYEGGPAVALVIRDITERKRAEEEMRVKDSAIESSINAIALAGLEGNLIYVNPSFLRLWGYDNDKEALGKPSVEFWQEAEEAAEIIGALFKKGSWQGELVALKKDGSTFDAQLSGSVVRDEDGKPICMMASFIDITKRKRAEEELLRHTERIEVTAELTRIITSSLNIEDVYEPFADGVKRLVDFDRFSIVLVEGDKARLVAVVSAVETELSTGVIAPLEGSAAEWVVENKRTNIETDFAQERQFPADEAHLRSGLRSAIRLPLFSRGEVIGTFNLSSRRSHAYGEREQEILEELAGQIAVAIENDRLYEEAKRSKEDLETAYEQLMGSSRALERSKDELEDAYLKMARTLVLTLEARDPYTRGHSERVAQLSRQIAYEMRLPPEQVKKIETAARLHDLGKIGIPDGILLKPDSLTPSERAEIQLHPTKTVDMLRHLGFLNGALPMIEGHHERYDGGGYPDGLAGEETPIGARILAVADAYDAMTSARPYRPAMTSEQAIKILQEGAGSQWDPEVVEAFLRAFGQSLHERENAD